MSYADVDTYQNNLLMTDMAHAYLARAKELADKLGASKDVVISDDVKSQLDTIGNLICQAREAVDGIDYE